MDFITSTVFTCMKFDTLLFILSCAVGMNFLLYVDGILLKASSPRLLDIITALLFSEFVMTDMGSLHYLLDIALNLVF
jgi:hypothetical protein